MSSIEHRIVRGSKLLVAGLQARVAPGPSPVIGELWGAMQPHFHGNAAYGVCHDFNDGTYFYLCAIQVTEAELNTLPEGWISLEIPEHDFAVYEHTDSVDKIGDTWTSIMHDKSVTRDHAIPSVEKYPATFHVSGGLTIWIPIATTT
ncbi:hypothetical protein H257_15651 [Aphanomyces astaci]|uniref:AraC effector-binding domain-containing protein n=2 Tax=Aphanomyces astaci TaxID=112090 RepID=W4FNB0_APHAT|nr:hypothetical protein H257_15651 [Aphanomyces astaci]ETV68329.1 hypothetical protein H257_15651 [Aphanomyces astaci]|eukprot:XP_009842124.1 hypothetical protein H257_15651 [Aphanomyces astaci]